MAPFSDDMVSDRTLETALRRASTYVRLDVKQRHSVSQYRLAWTDNMTLLRDIATDTALIIPWRGFQSCQWKRTRQITFMDYPCAGFNQTCKAGIEYAGSLLKTSCI